MILPGIPCRIRVFCNLAESLYRHQLHFSFDHITHPGHAILRAQLDSSAASLLNHGNKEYNLKEYNVSIQAYIYLN